jgi:methylmalonyl-CoA mutase
MANPLFSEFEAIESKQWKQQIQFELKGLDYNDTLVFESLEGIKIKPFYTSEDLPKTTAIAKLNEAFKILQDVYVQEANHANHVAKLKLEKGAESIWFIIPHQIDLNKLFNDLPTDITYFVTFHTIDDALKQNLSDFSKKYQIKVCVDPIHRLMSDGNWFIDKEKDLRFVEKIVNQSGILYIDSSLHQQAGANGVQQLAYFAAHLTEYLNLVKPQQIIVKWAIGNHYFFEIAKLKALRVLIVTLCDAFEISADIQIIAEPSLRNKTLYDYNVNMLRTTTEYMSAILGCANFVMPLAYDTLYHKSNAFGDRIARNQLLILKHESYFDNVLNPAEGTYFIESLTQTFAEKSLDLLKMIEKGGGLLENLINGKIQKHIIESAEKEQQWFDEGKIVLVGTNKYPNPQDQMKNDLELYPFSKIKPRKTLIKPINIKRLSEKLEKNRLEKEG